MNIAWLFTLGIGFGLTATVPPGPINSEIARRTFKFGWIPGLAFGLGSIVVENALALAASTGYGINLWSYPAVLPVMLFVGFMVLAIMGTISLSNGYQAWNDPKHAPGFEVKMPDGSIGSLSDIRPSPGLPRTQIASAPRSFFAGAGMAIISPYTIVFWIIGLPAVAHRWMAEDQHIWPLLGGILVGTFGWIWGFTAMLAWLKRYSTTWWIVWADLVGGVMLLVFAALALLKLVATVIKGPTNLPM